MTRRRPPCLTVADALTPEERREIEERWGAINPHYAGAPTADVLDILFDADAHLEVREPFFEEHPDLFEADSGVTSIALIAAVWLDADERPLEARVREILGRLS